MIFKTLELFSLNFKLIIVFVYFVYVRNFIAKIFVYLTILYADSQFLKWTLEYIIIIIYQENRKG